MTNTDSNSAWTVQFILNDGDAFVTRVEDGYEVEVLGDFAAETDTIEEAFELAEDMISFFDAVETVTVEVEEEIRKLEDEFSALNDIAHYLYVANFDVDALYSFLDEELDNQIELLEALDNYDYEMFVEDREEAELDLDDFIDGIVDELIADEEAFEANFQAEEARFEEEVNGNVRGPFSVI